MVELVLDEKDIIRINKLLANLSPKKQDGAIYQGLMKGCNAVLGQLVSNVRGIILKRRTGYLANSMGWRTQRDDKGNWEGIIGSGATLKTERMIYANIHEVGGIINAKPGKALAIPIGEALTPAGVARFKPRQITSVGYEDSFIRGRKGGNAILFGLLKGKAIPLFVLVKSVTIPARKYMTITAEQTAGKVGEAIISKIKEVAEAK